MSRKAGDLSGILAPKGKATSATSYPGDEPAQKTVKTTVQTAARTKAKTQKIPEHLRIAKPERRRDALNIRITPSERERIEALCERLDCNITQVLVLGIAAVERDLEG